jgi:uncharacterized protein with FMN-binding domain
MIPARTARLIVRCMSTALVIAVVSALVVIYLRSEGNGIGALAPVRQASSTRSTGSEHGSGSTSSNSASGSSAGSASSTCAPPRVCGSGAGGSSTQTSSTRVTYTGAVAENPYGPVQVQVTEQGGKIVDVKALQMPTEHALSAEISEKVAPMLRTEALQAQGPEISIISGASYTSESYASSLQAALRQGG